MRWFRSHRRVPSALAMFALLLQLALSFGHIHVGHAESNFAATDHDRAPAIGRAAPDPQDSDGHEDRYCPIYASLQLIGSAQLATPPAVALPHAFGAANLALGAAALVTEAPRCGFRSRAPPLT